MTRKRFIKLCMGKLGYSRDGANAAAKNAQKTSYAAAYNILSRLTNSTDALNKALKRVSVEITKLANALNNGIKAFKETLGNYTPVLCSRGEQKEEPA